jgi:hypothetical protein
MRTITTETKVYKFDELTEEQQEKVLDNWRQDWPDYEWWDCVEDDFKTICSLIGITVDKIYFSGFSSQGDGACFEGSYSYKKGSIKAVKEYAPLDETLHSIAAVFSAIQKTAHYSLNFSVKQSGHYNHSGCTAFNVDRSDDQSVTDEQEDGIIEAARDLMHWLYKTLEKEYDYLNSDESIKETIAANNYEFTANGHIA